MQRSHEMMAARAAWDIGVDLCQGSRWDIGRELLQQSLIIQSVSSASVKPHGTFYLRCCISKMSCAQYFRGPA